MASARSRIESGTVSRTRTRGDLRDDVVEAFDVLNVERGVDVDAVVQQLFDVEVALGMAAARDIGVGEFVDQRELRAPREEGVEVHLLELTVLVLEAMAGDDFEALQQRLGLLAPMRLDHADDDVVAVLLSGARLLQHLIGLADAGGRAEEDLQPAQSASFFLRVGKEGVRRGALVRLTPLICHASLGPYAGLARPRITACRRDPEQGSAQAHSRAARRKYRGYGPRYARRRAGERHFPACYAPSQCAGPGNRPPPA